MAYRRNSRSTGGYGRTGGRGGYSRTRYASRGGSRRATVARRRAPARRASATRAPREVRIVIEQAGASSVSRYPGIAAKMSPAPRKAKF